MSQWTLRQIAVRIYFGYSEQEIGDTLGMTSRVVRKRMNVLREELLNQG